jgi:hypothetical protein
MVSLGAHPLVVPCAGAPMELVPASSGLGSGQAHYMILALILRRDCWGVLFKIGKQTKPTRISHVQLSVRGSKELELVQGFRMSVELNSGTKHGRMMRCIRVSIKKHGEAAPLSLVI